MKKYIFVFLAGLTLFSKAQLSFTVTNQTGSYTLTCTNTLVSLYVTANTSNSIQCTWFGPGSSTVTGNSQTFTTAGTYTVTVKDIVTNSVAAQQFTIYQNTVMPNNSVSPLTQVINCGSPSASFTSTANSPSSNFVQNWYSPFSSYPAGPVSASTNFSVFIYNAQVPGTHTAEICNLINGCCTTKTVSVSSLSGFPTFQASSTNYVLGCAPLNQTTLCMVNVASASNGAVQYAFLSPGSFSAIPLPAGAFVPQTCTTTSAPGTWTLVVQDVINGCQSAMPVIINQNTVAPNVSATMSTQVLTCNNPTILATGSSTTTNTQISWMVPATPLLVPSYSVILGPPNGPPTSTNTIAYPGPTVVATNTLNGCKTTSAISISQNFKPPVPQISAGSPSVITCSGIPVLLNYTGSTGGSGVVGAYNTVVSWQGPPPQPTLSGINTYTAYIAGVYTLTVKDSYNGCTGSKTYLVADQTMPPSTAVSFSTSCATNMTIVPTFTGSTSNLSYSWTAPAGASIVGSATLQTVTANGFGTYSLVITNNNTACFTIDTYSVSGCTGLNKNMKDNESVSFYPNPTSKNLNVVFEKIPLKTELQIYDLQGKLIMIESLHEKNNSLVLNLEKGFYTVKIITEGRATRNEKLVVE